MRGLQQTYRSNSIQHRASGKWLETLVLLANVDDGQNLSNEWLFDWKKQIAKSTVYKLVTVEKPAIVQGLMCLEEHKGFFFVPLIENAPGNRGKDKEFRGIPGNLFAFACKISAEHGLGGFVAFDSKTALKEHYRATLGAKSIGSSDRMFIDEQQAQDLILFHFPKHK